MKILASLGMALLFSGVCFAEIVTVKVPSAEVRSKPSVYGSKVIMEAPKYYPLSIQGSENRYLQVRDFRGKSGWVHETLVGKNPGVVVEVAGSNVRQGPGKDNPVVFQAEQGDTFMVIGQQGDWLEIRDAKGRTGWIWKSLTWGL